MNNDEEVIESLSDKLKFQTIRKVFSERAEFIIIGLTGPIGGVIGEMTNVLAQDYELLEPYMSSEWSELSSEVSKELEYEHICNYAKRNWKKFDVIKARDVTYILENSNSYNYFIEDLEKIARYNHNKSYEHFLESQIDENAISRLLKAKKNQLEKEKGFDEEDYQKGESYYKESVKREIEQFMSPSTDGKSMLDRIKEYNDELCEFIGS